LARMLLKNYAAEHPEWPSEMLDNRLEAAKAKYAGLVDRVPALPDSP
jgi:acyl-CoA dehydrogenase